MCYLIVKIGFTTSQINFSATTVQIVPHKTDILKLTEMINIT